MLHSVRNVFGHSIAQPLDVANSSERQPVSVCAPSVFAAADVANDDASMERELCLDRTFQIDPELTAELECIRTELQQSPAQLFLADRMYAFSA